MPLDFTNNLIAEIPENLDFDVQYEDTKFDGKKMLSTLTQMNTLAL